MKHLTRVRQARKHHSLTQDELAQLLGIYQGNISRLESGATPPDLETAFSLQVIFGASLHDLFPALFEKIEDAVMRRAADFDSQLSNRPGFDVPAKRRLLKGMVLRARAKRHDL
jgi:DNA-binding XRE family transcriptional regulator